MKKYFIGSAIAIVFLAYSAMLRHQHSAPVIAPISLSQSKTATTGPSTVATPTITTPTAPLYKDGTYTGSVENAFYGNVQVAAIVSGGKIAKVNFLEYPNDNPNSINVNQQAMPYLKQEAVQVQSSKVSIISGATFTSQAFTQSLATALNQAKQG